MPYQPRVLFVCEHDAGAARLCAAYLRRLAGDRYEPIAAALEPAAGLRSEVASALLEDGLNLEDAPGLAMTPDLAEIVDRIITLGFTLNPEVARGVPREEWGIPDPAGRPVQEIRVIRDLARRLVERLVARLDTEAAVR
ncbi:MAG TPA: heat-shock protein HtpX [Acidimicrobiia bacterium]|nr:heat-shock protein HtpX [Acidimicrobiia bacterium]